ncbi:MAG: ComF family protein [Acidobacteriota bacterium]
MSYEEAVQSVLDKLVGTLWPDLCLACGVVVESSGGPHIGLCRGCRVQLRPAPAHRCARCGVELPAQSEVSVDRSCAACEAQPPPWGRLLWVWRYQKPLDAVVVGLKFRRLDYLARRLAAPLAEVVGDAGGPRFDAVVPVPLHWSRRIRRGYDQTTLLAAALARGLDLPVLPALRRVRATRAQSRRGRGERRRNLDAAFRVRRPVAGLRLLLVDDVVTTGATLESAASILAVAGASVDAAVVARTPGPGEGDPAGDVIAP